MSRAYPKVTAEWRASGWVSTSSHVRGSRRMLGIWAAGLVAAVVVAHHGHLYLAALAGVLAILGGAVVYTRLDAELTPPQQVGSPPAPAARLRGQDEAPALAAELRAVGGSR